MSASIKIAVLALASGECRWIGRHDIHVYCHAPAGQEARYSVVCPAAGLVHGLWVGAEDAAAIVERLLAEDPEGKP